MITILRGKVEISHHFHVIKFILEVSLKVGLYTANISNMYIFLFLYWLYFLVKFCRLKLIYNYTVIG